MSEYCRTERICTAQYSPDLSSFFLLSFLLDLFFFLSLLFSIASGI